MNPSYASIRITPDQAAQIARQLYQLSGDIETLPGELDFNFKITDTRQSYILKISRPEVSPGYIEFQQVLLDHVNGSKNPVVSPETVPAVDGRSISRIVDEAGNPRLVRLLTWIDGRLWSDVNPITDRLLESLGRQAGQVTTALQGLIMIWRIGNWSGIWLRRAGSRITCTCSLEARKRPSNFFITGSHRFNPFTRACAKAWCTTTSTITTWW